MSGRRQMRAVGKLAGGPLVWLSTGMFRFLAAPFEPRDPQAPAASTGMQVLRLVGQAIFVLLILGGLMWLALTLAL